MGELNPKTLYDLRRTGTDTDKSHPRHDLSILHLTLYDNYYGLPYNDSLLLVLTCLINIIIKSPNNGCNRDGERYDTQ